MARKDLPYLPLYVQDFLTDERLNECSASATGVYIKIMCVLHKSIPYGKFLLKQRDKQSSNQIENFALKFAKHLPYDSGVILLALEELINEEVLRISGDYLFQKRMVEDGELSATRSESGHKGGVKSQKKRQIFALAKSKANTENEIDINNNNTKVKIGENGETKFSGNFKAQGEELFAARAKRFGKENAGRGEDN